MELLERINHYWSTRAEEFSDARMADLKEYKRDRWLEQIVAQLPKNTPIRALDLGTGAGFFAFLLAELGCTVTGIDYSQEMVDHAKENAEKLGRSDIQFFRMDAQLLLFDDDSFDFIFTRNVTWTLPDPEKAYAEMFRVLAPGGKIMNCDANYGAAFREADRTGETEKSAVNANTAYPTPAQSLPMLRERNDITKELYISNRLRPQWDADVLLRLGAKKLTIVADIGAEIASAEEKQKVAASTAERLWQNASPLFMVVAEK